MHQLFRNVLFVQFIQVKDLAYSLLRRQ